jgi:hypothetical protein
MCVLTDATMINVCSSCQTAACWLGVFFCDEYQTAHVVERSVKELKALRQESPDYWAVEIRSRTGRL